jgi:hypothetical protein
MARRCGLLLTAVVFGCASPPLKLIEPLGPASCPAYAPGRGRPVGNAADLAGDYDLVSVVTSFGPPPAPWRGHLTLQRVVQQDDQRPIALVGAYSQAGVRGSSAPRPDSVSVVGDTLILGPWLMLDMSAPRYYIRARTDNGFWGQWYENVRGNGMHMTDSTGRELPDPAGHFCAVRR